MDENKVKEIVGDIEKNVAETVTAPITEEVMKRVMDELPNRKDIFAGDNDANREEKEQKEKAAEFVRKLAAGESTKGLTAGTATSGAELVPTYVADEVVRVAGKFGLVRRYARPWPMQGSNENIPTLSSVSAFRVNEGAKINASQPTSGNVALRGKTVGVIIPISEKLLRNATIDVVNALNMLAGEAIAKLEDQWGILGLAAGEGIFQHASVPELTLGSGDTTYAKVEPEDLLDALNLVSEDAVDENMRWVHSLSLLNALRKKRSVVGSDNQGFLFQGFGGSTPPTMWDIPYSTSSIMPKTSDGSQNNKVFMALANFNYMIHGDSKQYSMAISDQATITDTDGSTLINLFEQNMVALKVWGEIDIQLAEPAKAFARIKTANT